MAEDESHDGEGPFRGCHYTEAATQREGLPGEREYREAMTAGWPDLMTSDLPAGEAGHSGAWDPPTPVGARRVAVGQRVAIAARVIRVQEPDKEGQTVVLAIEGHDEMPFVCDASELRAQPAMPHVPASHERSEPIYHDAKGRQQMGETPAWGLDATERLELERTRDQGRCPNCGHHDTVGIASAIDIRDRAGRPLQPHTVYHCDRCGHTWAEGYPAHG